MRLARARSPSGPSPAPATRLDPTRDEELAEELLSDPKEHAEHLMLLDLGRNDVGRVAMLGTREGHRKFFIERYSHVMHIVSNVEGELDPSHDFVDVLAAGFPAGTLSGAPKVRAMEIIDELERSAAASMAARRLFRRRRHGGHLHRPAHRPHQGRRIYVQAGGGVVADSDPEPSTRMREQGARPVQRRRGSATLCRRGAGGAVMMAGRVRCR